MPYDRVDGQWIWIGAIICRFGHPSSCPDAPRIADKFCLMQTSGLK